MANEYFIEFTIGDCSGDGHEKRERFVYKSNKPFEDILKTHQEIKTTLGIDMDKLWHDYEDKYVPGELLQLMQQNGEDPDEWFDYYDGYRCEMPDTAMLIWAKLLQLADPTLKLTELHLDGRMHGVGYGIFV